MLGSSLCVCVSLLETNRVPCRGSRCSLWLSRNAVSHRLPSPAQPHCNEAVDAARRRRRFMVLAYRAVSPLSQTPRRRGQSSSSLMETPRQHREIFVRQLSLILQTFYTPPPPFPISSKVHPVFLAKFLARRTRANSGPALAIAIQGHASCVFNQNSITVPHHAPKPHSPGYEVWWNKPRP